MLAESDMSVAISDASLLTESRVVVVDDHPGNVLVLRRLLEMGGLQDVEGYTDPRLALERCLESPPDLMLLDLRMPGLDGFAVLAALRAALPAGAFLPVLVLTADDSAETKSQALASGAKDFLAKPFDATEVVLRVRNLLETKDLYSRLQRHNAQLQAELDEQLARERREAAEFAAGRSGWKTRWPGTPSPWCSSPSSASSTAAWSASRPSPASIPSPYGHPTSGSPRPRRWAGGWSWS